MGSRHQGRRQVRRLIAACCLVAAPAILAAADVYRWVDDQGKAHVSDRPPANPPANMTREALPDPDTNTHQGLDVQRRPPPQLAPMPAGRAPASAQPPAPASADCKARWAAYQASQACYESYRTSDAGLKPEAFEACGPDMPDPAAQCGPVR